jgi:hypothetical protein
LGYNGYLKWKNAILLPKIGEGERPRNFCLGDHLYSHYFHRLRILALFVFATLSLSQAQWKDVTLGLGALPSKFATLGDNWVSTSTGLIGKTKIYAMLATGTVLFAGTQGNGLFTSTNNGDTWTQVTGGLAADLAIFSFAMIGNNIFAGTSENVFISSNNGEKWDTAGTGLPNGYAIGMGINGSSLFAAVTGAGAFKLNITNKNNSIRSSDRNSQLGFTSRQSRFLKPNAIIEFTVGNTALVNLSAFDPKGNLVEKLENSIFSVGSHATTFHGQRQYEGTYYLRLTSQGFSQAECFIISK